MNKEIDYMLFPQLGARSVFVKTAGGVVYECSMLGVGDYDRVNKTIEFYGQRVDKEAVIVRKDDEGNETTITDTADMTNEEVEQVALISAKLTEEAKDRLHDVIRPCLPKEIQDTLCRLGYADTTALANFLYYGDGKEESYSPNKVDQPKKKS